MSPKDREYYRRRAAAERRCAGQATNDVAAQIHEELACLYEKLVELEEQAPTPTFTVITGERMTA